MHQHVESLVSAFMRNFQNSTMNFDNSRGNQFQSYPPQSQVLNNVNIQLHSIIQSQPQHYPMNGSNQHVNGFPSLASFNANNPTLPVNASNQLMNDFPSSQKMALCHQLLNSYCLHQAFFLHFHLLNTLSIHIYQT
ncbi:hypothetical protein MtrunA17_Chr4g0039771 [Medicago truncatula]|uniref:Uncharacterized protein n=1 Tax=Medicago truncatula TaxID=3880 RepID=A0A396IAC7_MEDTR|nr:hypothetical protein MtrunA17_Chr4g0039771 [Medicago truncatula]